MDIASVVRTNEEASRFQDQAMVWGLNPTVPFEAKWIWVKIKPPEDRRILVLGSIYGGFSLGTGF